MRSGGQSSRTRDKWFVGREVEAMLAATWRTKWKFINLYKKEDRDQNRALRYFCVYGRLDVISLPS